MLSTYRALHFTTLMGAALAVVIGTIPDEAFGQRRGGGGGRAASSVHRGGGGGGQMASRAQAPRQATRPSAGANRGGGGGQAYGGGNRAYGGGNTANRGGNRAYSGDVNRGGNRVNTGDVNRGGNRVNTGNINVGNNVNVDVDGGWDNNGWGYHPVARGVAFGAAAAVTAAAVGSVVYSLPPSCRSVVYGPSSYSQCGDIWYMPQYSGSSVTYVVVDQPY